MTIETKTTITTIFNFSKAESKTLEDAYNIIVNLYTSCVHSDDVSSEFYEKVRNLRNAFGDVYIGTTPNVKINFNNK